MSTYRLRSNTGGITLRGQATLIGRSSECQIVLAAAGVSRRHARLTLTAEGVVVEDLQSANGVFVNGSRITTQRKLEAGDRLLIAGETFMLEAGADQEPKEARTDRVTARSDHPVGEVNEDADESTDRRDAFELLGPVVDTLLATRRVSEAEAALDPLFFDAMATARSGKLRPSQQDVAVRAAIKLARATSKASWIECAFDLSTAAPRVLPEDVVHDLYDLVRKAPGVRARTVRRYVEAVTASGIAQTPTEIFLLKRVAGLLPLLRS